MTLSLDFFLNGKLPRGVETFSLHLRSRVFRKVLTRDKGGIVVEEGKGSGRGRYDLMNDKTVKGWYHDRQNVGPQISRESSVICFWVICSDKYHYV